MKTVIGIGILSVAMALVGCSSTMQRTAIVGAGAAAAGAVGYAVSDEDPLATGAAAVGGALLTSAALGKDPAVAQEGFDKGYVQGQSDAIKRQYWLRQALQREEADAEEGEDAREVYYTVPGPEQTADGKKLEPHTVTIKVTE